jgi:hypothetical protein
VFKKVLYNGISKVSVARVTKTFTLKGVPTIQRSTPSTMDSLYALMYHQNRLISAHIVPDFISAERNSPFRYRVLFFH